MSHLDTNGAEETRWHDDTVSSRKWFGIIAGLGCFVIALIIATTQP